MNQSSTAKIEMNSRRLSLTMGLAATAFGQLRQVIIVVLARQSDTSLMECLMELR